MIKIAIPTNSNAGLHDEVAEHFGRCNTYTILSENGELIEVINNTSEHMGGKGLPPEVIRNAGGNILLCNELGPRALNLCKELSIEVFVVHTKTVKEAFETWKNATAKTASMDDICEEHKQ